jgi:PAS domain S-box-containing protein
VPETRFFDFALDLLAVGGFDGKLRRVNPAWTQTLGWTAEELLSTPYANLFHPDDLDNNLDKISKTATGADTVTYETRLRRRDGSYQWVLASVRSDRAAGEVYIVAKDIQERRDTEDQLRVAEAELRFRVELEDLVTAMSTRFLGAHGDELEAVVESALGELCAYLGLDRAYVLKTDESGPGIELFVEWWADGVPRTNTPIPELPVDAQRFWVRSLRSGQPVHAPEVERNIPTGGESAMAALARDGVRSILLVPLRARDLPVGFMGFEARTSTCAWSEESISLMRTVGELFVGAVDRRRVEAALASTAAELERRNSELERSNRELEQFASIVSHDLKSPLQVVRGFVELLGREPATNAEELNQVQTYVAAALRGAARMDRLIDDLLAYSRAGQRPAEFVLIDLGAVANEVLADSAALIAETDATVIVDSLPSVPGDSTQLHQLLQNLITNAIKFRRTDVKPEVRVTAREANDRWIVDVVDNGIGIDPEHRDEIFAMFSRLHHGDRPGSGIGLAICARVVANHGGRIWAERADGEGSRLRFTLSKTASTSSRDDSDGDGAAHRPADRAADE